MGCKEIKFLALCCESMINSEMYPKWLTAGSFPLTARLYFLGYWIMRFTSLLFSTMEYKDQQLEVGRLFYFCFMELYNVSQWRNFLIGNFCVLWFCKGLEHWGVWAYSTVLAFIFIEKKLQKNNKKERTHTRKRNF